MKFFKPIVFLLCLAPLALLIGAAATGGLSANPLDDITDTTGRWTLRFLLIVLAVSPLRHLTGWNGAARFRRMLGLFAFFYGFLHFLTYIWFDWFFDFSEIVLDVGKRPFITAGFASFVLMIPLAATSTRKWIARLGGRRWQLLHRTAYVCAAAGVLHYFWLVKLDTRAPLVYAGILAALLGFRVWRAVMKPAARPQAAAQRSAAE